MLACTLLRAQGTEPKKSASLYPVHAQAGDVEYGAEYMVHTVAHQAQSFIVDDYLVVEAAVFPKFGTKTQVNAQQFFLRINGKKDVIFAHSPAMVAASLRYADWRMHPRAVGSIGMGGADVILGAPTPTPRFPGDNRAPGGPQPPRAPDDPAKPQPDQLDPAQALNEAALPEGEMKFPVSGYVYFGYTGKLSKIKTVELLVKTGSGEPIALRLR